MHQVEEANEEQSSSGAGSSAIANSNGVSSAYFCWMSASPLPEHEHNKEGEEPSTFAGKPGALPPTQPQATFVYQPGSESRSQSHIHGLVRLAAPLIR